MRQSQIARGPLRVLPLPLLLPPTKTPPGGRLISRRLISPNSSLFSRLRPRCQQHARSHLPLDNASFYGTLKGKESPYPYYPFSFFNFLSPLFLLRFFSPPLPPLVRSSRMESFIRRFFFGYYPSPKCSEPACHGPPKRGSWGASSSRASTYYDINFKPGNMNTQKICVRGVDQRKLELMLYEKFGHDCRLQVCPSAPSYALLSTFLSLQARFCPSEPGSYVLRPIVSMRKCANSTKRTY